MRRRRSLVAAVVVVVLAAGAATAYWTAESDAGGYGAAAAASVDQGATPTAVVGADGAVTVSWAATTVSNGAPVTGYRVDRHADATSKQQAVQGGCEGTVTALTCTESDVPTGSWQYTVTPLVAANWRGPASARSATVAVDRTAPVNDLTVTGAGGAAHQDGSTVWYRGSGPGSLTLTNAVTDAHSGPASSRTSALAADTAGWSHTPSTVSAPAGGPYVSAPFGWAGGTSTSPTVTVTGRDAAGNEATSSLTFRNDSGNPLFGSTSYPDGYTSGRSVTVSFDPGWDFESGIDHSMGRLKRSVAPLVDGACGAFVTNNRFALAPTSPYVDTTVRAGSCYSYQYVATDHVGNKGFYGTSHVAKVDYAGAVQSQSSLLSFWRFGEDPITSTDYFTGSTGTPLSTHSSQDGTTWTRRAGDTTTVALTSADDVRASGGGRAVYYTDETPTSGDYLVEGDVIRRGSAASTGAGVVGRLDPSGAGSGTYYSAVYDGDADRWELAATVDGDTRLIGTHHQGLSEGRRYRVGLAMKGSTIQLLVDGVVRVAGTDTSITAAGRSGVAMVSGGFFGDFSGGLHLDDFVVSPAGVDSVGTNTADYHRGVTLGAAGVAPGNTAATFDGSNDYAKSATTQAFPVGASARSVELWFKTPGPGPWQGRQALFSYGTDVDTQEFGVWLETDGHHIKSDGGGSSDRVLWWPTNFHDNQWHHFVSTYDGTSTKMYVDGVLGWGNTTATKDTVINPTHGFAIGAILDDRPFLPTNSFFRGSMDEMALYGTALSPETIAAHHELGRLPAPDTTTPTGGSVQALGLGGTGGHFSTSTTLDLSLTRGSDPSGIAPSGNQLTRSTGTLSGGACSGFGGYAFVADDPAATVTDTVADGACYRYAYVVFDAAGNQATYVSDDIAVDLTAPDAPALAFEGIENAWAGAGSTVYYRSAAGSGSFTATADAVDSGSGIGSYDFPALGEGWTATPGQLGQTTYSWSGTPEPPGARSVTATNGAGLTGTAAPFTLQADDTAPTDGSITYDASPAGDSVSLAFTTGTDGGSGVGTRLLQRSEAPASGSTCGSFGAFSTITGGTDPASPVTDTIARHTCYQYRYVVADRVGNQTVATGPTVIRSVAAHWSFDEGDGTSAADSSGSGSTATLYGGSGWSAGRVGPSALHLTASSAGSAASSGPVVDTAESYTVAAWIKPESLNGFRTAVSIDGNNVSAFFLQISGDGRYGFHQYAADSSSNPAVVAGPVATSDWAHLVGVYDKDAGSIRLYVNGVLQGTAGTSGAFTATGGTVIGRAKYNWSLVDWFDGTIDDVRLYDRVLTPAEVSALANP